MGAALRACSCYGVPQLFYTGDRVPMPDSGKYGKKRRLPREERMKGYADVELVNCDMPFDRFINFCGQDGHPAAPEIVCIELVRGAAPLTWHEHKPESIYVFGPEDGSVSKAFKGHCHTFLYIPAKHCLNLAAAVYTVLYDRQHKAHFNGHDPMGGPGSPLSPADVSNEDRGWISDWGENGR